MNTQPLHHVASEHSFRTEGAGGWQIDQDIFLAMIISELYHTASPI